MFSKSHFWHNIINIKSMAEVFLKRQNGFSLIQTIVALGVMSIIALSMTELYRHQQRGMKLLSQKYDILNLQNSLNSLVITSSTACTSQLAGQTFSTDGVTSTTPSSSVVSFPSNEIRAGAAATGYLLAKAGDALLGSSVIINSIQVSNILYTGVPGRYIANLAIDYDPNSLIQLMKPLRMNLVIYATVSGTTATITSCGNESKLNCSLVTAWTGSQTQQVFCPPNTTSAWGGCDIVGSGGVGSEDIISDFPIANGWQCGSSHPSRDIRAYIACCN